MASLPYVTAPGNIEKALNAIKSAATPERVTHDFVKTILKISGGSGDQMTSFLRKIGFVNSDGTPSDIYRKFRNSATSGRAIADALKLGYSALYKRNEYMHGLPDNELKGLIIEETGQGEDSSAVSLVLTAIKNLRKFANFSTERDETSDEAGSTSGVAVAPAVALTPGASVPMAGGSVGLNLSYTINLNLPATSDISVFNAIFKSLKENLLRGATDA